MTDKESPLIYICYICAAKVNLTYLFAYGTWSKGKCAECGEFLPRVQVERVRFTKLMEEYVEPPEEDEDVGEDNGLVQESVD